MLSEEAKEHLRIWKDDLSEWKIKLKNIQDCLNNREKLLKNYEEAMQGPYPTTEERIREILRKQETTTQEIVNYLENWWKINSRDHLLLYNPSIEKEIKEFKYENTFGTFKLITIILGLIFLFLLLYKR